MISKATKEQMNTKWIKLFSKSTKEQKDSKLNKMSFLLKS